MADLPARPSLDHLRRQARDLLRAAQAGDTAAAGRIRAVSDALTLASAQLAVAPDAAGRRRRPQRPHRRGGRARRLDPAALRGRRCGQPAHHQAAAGAGAVPGDDDLYLAGFADDNHECLLLRQHGADVTVTGTDRLLAACQDADRAKVERLLAAEPGLPGRIPAAQQAAAMIHAAESGNTGAITLLLDLGFPVDARGDDGGTPLHAAAYSGSAPAVRLLPLSGTWFPRERWTQIRQLCAGTRLHPRADGFVNREILAQPAFAASRCRCPVPSLPRHAGQDGTALP